VKALGANAAARVTRFLCKLHGSSQPILAEASDGRIYVVKFPQINCANFLFNECLGSNLYMMFGLICPPWKPLILTDDFLDDNPGCWMAREHGFVRPTAGLCFGSCFMGTSKSRLWEILPSSWLKRIHSPFDFWRAWFLDLNAEHYDTRQAIFQEEKDHVLHPWFIDHGYMFGGPNDRSCMKTLAPRYLDPRIYGEMPVKRFTAWVQAVGELKEDTFLPLMDGIPDDWKTQSALSAFDRFIRRTLDHNLARILIREMEAAHRAFGQRRLNKEQDWRNAPIGREAIPAIHFSRDKASIGTGCRVPLVPMALPDQ